MKPSGIITTPRIPILVVGVGNLLMGDDGVGVHAVQLLQANHAQPGVVFIDAGTAILSVLGEIERANRLLLIDVIQTGAAPGTLHQLRGDEVAPPRTPRSLHEYGVGHVLAQISPDLRSSEILVIGVEPAVFDFGGALSRPVREALPRLVKLATGRVAHWQAEPLHSREQKPCDLELIS